MNFIVLSFFLYLSHCHSAEIGVKKYDGYQVIRAILSNQAQYESLLSLYNEGSYDFWAGPSKTAPVDIMVDPLGRAELLKFLETHGIHTEIFIEDVGKIIQVQKSTSRRTSEMNWEDYQLLETVYDWLDDLVAHYPNLISVTNIGKSTEGRDLKVLKITTGGSNKTAFWIDATIHAREWVATSTVTYIINELVTKSQNYADLFSVLDFYIFPVVNPDGYSYSHSNDRMWRKTRSNHNSIYGCRGVDANRNFGFHWGENGSSNDKCDETYRGPEAYSEPETLAMKNYIESLKGLVKWDAFITLHSYSQLWMTPYGYTEDLTHDYAELKSLGDKAVKALGNHYGTQYRVGNAASILYYSSGSSRDWAKGEGGFKYVYTIELRDTGKYGFLLPKEQIIPTAVETWSGIQVIAKQYLRK